MSDFFQSETIQKYQKMHILGAKVQNFSGGGPPDPPLTGRLRLLLCRLAKIPAENPEAVFILYNNLRKRFFISYKKPLEAIKNLLRL